MSLSCCSFTVVRFVVTAWNEEPSQFMTEPEAVRAAMAAARRSGAADYCRVMGDPISNVWKCPEPLGGFECPDLGARPKALRRYAGRRVWSQHAVPFGTA